MYTTWVVTVYIGLTRSQLVVTVYIGLTRSQLVVLCTLV